MTAIRFVGSALFLTAFLAVCAHSQADYGVDCSFPIHSKEFNCGNLLGDRKQIYEDFMEGCRKRYSTRASRCDSTEDDRIEMSLRQPQSMVNYTETGFKKIRAPNSVMDLLNAHWKRNRDGLYDREEIWPAGSIYVNHWESPTYMSAVEDTNTRGGGYALKKAVWDAVKPVVEAWTGMEQKPISMYGIRAYTEGAILSPHVDRLPLVSSCIINVDQDVDEDWPLEVYDRHDRAVNITMQPGDLVLYESGSLMHGRPFPLKGRFYANIFIHFEPTGRKLGDTSLEYLDELDDILPPYLLAGSPESDNWARKNPHGWSKPLPSAPIQQVTSPEGHRAAAIGDLARLSKLAQTNRRALHAKDENGWQPLHEAVRADNKEAVELLIQHGANKDARVGKKGEGASALNLALDFLSVGADTVNYLMSIGAQNIEPDL